MQRERRVSRSEGALCTLVSDSAQGPFQPGVQQVRRGPRSPTSVRRTRKKDSTLLRDVAGALGTFGLVSFHTFIHNAQRQQKDTYGPFTLLPQASKPQGAYFPGVNGP